MSELDEQLEEIRERRYVNLDESQAESDSIEWQSLNDIGWLLGYVDMLRADANRRERPEVTTHIVEDQKLDVFKDPRVKTRWPTTFITTRKPELLRGGTQVFDPPWRTNG